MNKSTAGQTRDVGTLLVALSLASLSLVARADQSGVPFWLSGQFASLAAVPATPGWSLVVSPYYYNGSADKSRTFQTGETVSAGLKSIAPLVFLQPGYAFEDKVLGGRPYVALGWGPGNNRTSTDVSLTQPSHARFNNDSVTGGSDLYPFASLAWAHGNDNWMTYVTGDIPVGAYDSKRLSNIGIGHAAIDGGAGYTYLNNSTGREFSAVLGITYNWENTHTNYKNGIDSHLDWAASQFLSANWQVGVAGYVYYQLTGDSGSGDRVGAFKSRIAAIGPELGYAFKLNQQAAYFNLRAYKEFWARNRIEGYAVFATLSIPL
ncbi:transporter [Variovorax sp. J31P179]|uniref:SphA family protein n=1 Tax=Variovorax sp. J31P179 TaxID=3053508 RepID=UPI0025768547|nr:transporter [Variovorax sp. J31P179]